MNAVELLMDDDIPNGAGIHLTKDQRLNAFEHMWSLLSIEWKQSLKEVIGLNG